MGLGTHGEKRAKKENYEDPFFPGNMENADQSPLTLTVKMGCLSYMPHWCFQN